MIDSIRSLHVVAVLSIIIVVHHAGVVSSFTTLSSASASIVTSSSSQMTTTNRGVSTGHVGMNQHSYHRDRTMWTRPSSSLHMSSNNPGGDNRDESNSNSNDDGNWSPNEDEATEWANPNAGLNPEFDDDLFDWQTQQANLETQKPGGSYWSTFESSSNNNEDDRSGTSNFEVEEERAQDEIWLDTLQSLQQEEVEFTEKEADRAIKLQKMQEFGFDDATIEKTLGVSLSENVTSSTGSSDEEPTVVADWASLQEELYEEETEVDYATVESHANVDIDEETGEPSRQQMVYVDEHTCIGCTNCAMIAQSTFMMEGEHGRARVFQQWGDDEETIQVAIETCPVDCIHYVPYDELVRLELERRDQNINFKARLVGNEGGGSGGAHMVGSAVKFSQAQRISTDTRMRCSNCPSRGCADCPMFGVGKNPAFEKREQERKARAERRRLQEERAQENKSADL